MNQFLIATLAFLFLHSIHFPKPVEKPEIAISTAGNPRILAGIDNPIVIVAQQAKPVYRNQISLRFEHPNPDSSSRAVLTGDKGHFRLWVDTTGILILSIKTEQGIVEKKLRCIALDVVTRFGGLNKSGKMSSAVFKAQGGIMASIECCDINAQCKVIDFEILKFNARSLVFRGSNTGGSFDATIRPIINRAQAGDIYWFRNIRYRCLGSEPSFAQDIAIEIE
ncbi:MAG: GldM family protein [Haliscomenobacter sp.]|uniref:GldM family protein n=1 Tax=Haliscomenobacter sp. TaxID=2717303 RepID=UPI0029B4B08B|nr:GldM family protein [Haliscomenobacter sp.]MDX2072380.1 GldM family protein [Haliscomenobacter sp.]